jgi:protein subunit release factor A
MIIELRPAEGGDDAKLFMQDLAKTYTSYLDSRG